MAQTVEHKLFYQVIPDASVSVKWANPDEEKADLALLLLQDWRKGRIYLFAPQIWEYEVAQGILKAYLAGTVSKRVAERRLRRVLALPLPRYPNPPAEAILKQYAWRYLDEGLPSRQKFYLYDALYVGWAEDSDAILVTEDRKILQNSRVKKRGVQVLDLEGYRKFHDERLSG